MAEVSNAPWGDVSQADYPTAASYCSACLIDMNEPGADKAKSKCKLPVREPPGRGGKINRAAVSAAGAALAGARGPLNAPPDAKRAAARKLASIYRNSLGTEPPPSVARLAK